MQAPLGPAATLELVGAVSASGALGTLAGSWTPAGELGEQVRSLRALSEEPFCVNLVLAFEQRERLICAVQAGAPIVSFSWGVDAELIGLTRDSGAFVLVQVGTVDEAAAAATAGADALIVQGVEAGGHLQATRSLVELLREIRRPSQVPLVAAGGIADPASVNEALEAGADAVACGTVFLAAAEADVHPTYLDRLIAADAADTTVTNVFDGGWPGAPHRVIRNDTVTAWEAAQMPKPGLRAGESEPIATRSGHLVLRYAIAQPTRDTIGEVELMAMYAGTSVRAIQRREPASKIIERLATRL
jgi:NAD(P)H-dependent flavin oxidoreductase YrpB (nitropropane dioxygenase family)